jgi:hypothetical protein
MQELTAVPMSYPTPVPIAPEMSIAEIRDRKNKIHQLMKELMIEGHHYGRVPGTDKLALLKPGAEMLCMAFRLMPTFNTPCRELADGHREYSAECDLTAMDGRVVAKGVGSCSTMESKYRWRLASRKCPDCGTEAIRKGKPEYGGGFYCADKQGGCGAKFKEGDKRIIDQALGKVPNPDIADQWNTVLKMAAKRAHVHAVLLATAASDMFIPDEDGPPGDDDEGDDKDKGDDKPKRGGKSKADKTKPPPELTPRQKLMGECQRMQAELMKQGRTKEGLVDLLGTNSVVMPPKWGDLSEADLAIVQRVFAEELKLGAPAK